MNDILLRHSSVWLRRGNKLLDAALTREYFPWVNPWVHWLKRPVWGLAAATVAAFLCGVFVNPFLLAVAAGMAGLLVLGTVWPLVAIRGLSCTVRFPRQRCREGDFVTVEVEIGNRWPIPAWGLQLVGGFERAAGDDAPEIAVASVPGWSRVRIPWRHDATRRGVYPRGTPRLETGFPFGLIRAGVDARFEGELVVWPRAAAVGPLPDAAPGDCRESRSSSRRAGPHGDVMGSRTFRQGDALRSINWSQSARHGGLIVSEREAPSTHSVEVIVDTRASVHSADGPECTIEPLLRVAAGLLETLHDRQTRVACVIERRRLCLDAAAHGLHRVLDELARAGLGTTLPPRHSRSAVDGRFVVTTEHGLESARTSWPSASFWIVGSHAARPRLLHRHSA